MRVLLSSNIVTNEIVNAAIENAIAISSRLNNALGVMFFTSLYIIIITHSGKMSIVFYKIFIFLM